MATGSPRDPWMSTTNATSASYRNSNEHLARELPVLVGNGREVVRVQWGKKPHRKANQLGKEFSAVPDQVQPNT